MIRFTVGLRIWLVSMVACATIVAFVFLRMDVTTALYFWNTDRPLSPLNRAFGARVILSAEAAAIIVMVLARLVRGHIPVFGKTLVIACLASMCAYVINDQLLKAFCGVPNPTEVMHGAEHSFNLWMGPENSSFPSGHMALAGAFAGVFMRLHKVSIWPFAALLLTAAGLLLVGDWHFPSDIIAGAFLGTSAGILAGEAWAAHSAR